MGLFPTNNLIFWGKLALKSSNFQYKIQFLDAITNFADNFFSQT